MIEMIRMINANIRNPPNSFVLILRLSTAFMLPPFFVVSFDGFPMHHSVGTFILLVII
jgi:hypothetical protein